MAEDLFGNTDEEPVSPGTGGSLRDARVPDAPLAVRMRPRSLDEIVGQKHLLGPGSPLRRLAEGHAAMSVFLWGPPGVGKTTLARIYAHALNAEIFELSAVSAGKEDIKKILKTPSLQRKVLFLDEIHRFNKAQQDFLLPYVESGALTLIGATTENPSFEVIGALLSRSRVFVLNELAEDDMRAIVKRTKLKVPKMAADWLVRMANGDARQMLTLMEQTQELHGVISVATLETTLQSTHLRYDKKGEEHFNTISAFIKSMRAGDADAAMYYLARMVEAGEDPLFIARRMVIFASEDVGLAQPTALVVANEVFRACETIGYPECAINLAHGVAYLALAKKDRRAYDALRAAQRDIREYGNLPIPTHLRNAPTKLMKELGYGDGQKWEAGFRHEKGYLPDKLKKKKYLG